MYPTHYVYINVYKDIFKSPWTMEWKGEFILMEKKNHFEICNLK